MPTYVYKFVDTGETIEVQQSFTDDSLTEAVHPTSGATMKVKKVFTPVGVTFKGGGFYKTDSRGSSKSKSAASTPADTPSTSTDSSSTTSSSTPTAARRAPPVSTTTPSRTRCRGVLSRRGANAASLLVGPSPNRCGSRVREVVMHVVTRLRLLLVRRPWVWWSAVAVTALVVGVAVSGAVRRLDEQRRSWGERRTVWVAAEAAEPGGPLVTEARSYPVALIPDDAVTDRPARWPPASTWPPAR